jgi:hypothetical protein
VWQCRKQQSKGHSSCVREVLSLNMRYATIGCVRFYDKHGDVATDISHTQTCRSPEITLRKTRSQTTKSSMAMRLYQVFGYLNHTTGRYVSPSLGLCNRPANAQRMPHAKYKTKSPRYLLIIFTFTNNCFLKRANVGATTKKLPNTEWMRHRQDLSVWLMKICTRST